MDTKSLEKFCPWAREKLIDAIHARCVLNGLDDAGRAAAGIGSEVIAGRVLNPDERQQRDNLFKRIETVGYNAFVDEEAYTWFNRFMGIRYMEVHGYLPSGIRVLSDTDDSFDPACLRAAGELDLPGLDRDQAIDLSIAGKRAELFRLILIAQCNQLADALPSVFDHVDDADALVLPDGLLNKDENNVLYHLVEDIPEETWNDVEIMGWMYQFYNKELKDAFFASKRKAAPEDLAPATQLFTPEWIVRYMVDNSLGRLWMLNHPESHLIERAQAENPADRLMEYYIAPDEEHEDFIRVASPEDITFCDPACGSGHILVYAFKMLMAIYEECGYRTRDIPELILTKNLSGMEIDPRAAQIATLVLAMCAREHDRRFFSRNVKANIQVLHNVAIDADSLVLTNPLRQKPELLDTLAHLGEIGSLFAPTDDDIAALEGDLHESPVGDLFSARANENVDTALSLCKALRRRFDVVVANPPYMGSSSLNPFMSKWMKKNYPDSCKDLCTAFIERGISMVDNKRFVSMITASSWMFLSSFEQFRTKLITTCRIASMIQQSTHGFPFVTVPTTMFSLQKHSALTTGSYIRLENFDRPQWQQPRALEAIHNPSCGWFYRANATTFHDIPGSPIAYWASEGLHEAFQEGASIETLSDYTGSQNKTGDNAVYLRFVWEPSSNTVGHRKKWCCYSKGGDFRRWYGNLDIVINWSREARAFYKSNPTSNLLKEQYWFTEGISYTMLTSGKSNFRYQPPIGLFDMAGPVICKLQDNLYWLLAFLNCSLTQQCLSMMNPTLNLQAKDVKALPVIAPLNAARAQIEALSKACVAISRTDWDSQETSWDFKRNPLV